MGSAQPTPVVAGRLSFEHEDRRHPPRPLGRAVDVVKQLSQAKPDLLVLPSASQALDLSDVHGSITRPSSVELGSTTPVRPCFDARSTKMSAQSTDRLLMGSSRGIDPIPVDSERFAAGPVWRTARLERPSEDSVADLRDDDDLAAAAAKPPARGRNAGEQVAEPVGVDHVHVPAPPAGVLRADEFAAVTALRVDDLLTGEVAMNQQRHLRRPVVTPAGTLTLRPLSAVSLRHPGTVDEHISGVGDGVPTQRRNPPVALG